MSAKDQWKKYFLAQLGCGPDGEDVKPPKPAPPHGRMKLFANYFKLAALLALLGYFLFLLIGLIVQFAEDTAEPPLRFSQKPGTKGEPFFPAIALCHTGFNRSLKLLEVGVNLVGLGEEAESCFPEQGSDNCDESFPKALVNAWAFNIRNKEPVPNDPNAPPVVDATVPDTDGSFDQNCIAINVSRLTGYESVEKERFRQRLAILVSFDKPPNNGSLTHTRGLNGLDVYFFQDGASMPGGPSQVDQAAEEGAPLGFKNLFGQPALTTFQNFQAFVDDEIILGADLMTYMSISKTLSQIPDSDTPRASYNPNAIVTPLNRANFANPQSPEIESNSTQLAVVTITYATPSISYFENTPPSFAAFLGQIGGLKGIASDFLGAALVALAFLTSVHSARYPAPLKASTQVAVSEKA